MHMHMQLPASIADSLLEVWEALERPSFRSYLRMKIVRVYRPFLTALEADAWPAHMRNRACTVHYVSVMEVIGSNNRPALYMISMHNI
jgi:hypothetical protein